ncbi:hypothetical protein K7711_37815 [Nocardia sp. CA2R105]|uniref:hypothetical protein n=1 Tax=Nocardia coffeae TaxID=2873381 RepID=UPI001CA70579|nr:hypothetical protein [Nocardia coffeae]MBY8862280.1 hypothetical protein [Nocardia coffeae]
MDPISLGVAAAALVATKFGEQFAKDAGDTAWHAVERLRNLVTDRFRREPEIGSAITALTDAPTLEAQAVVAQRIADTAREDSGFASEIDGLVTAARQNRPVEIVVAQAFDDARQVNVHGDNTGTINIG